MLPSRVCGFCLVGIVRVGLGLIALVVSGCDVVFEVGGC